MQLGIQILLVIGVVVLSQVLLLARAQRRRHEELRERLARLESRLDR